MLNAVINRAIFFSRRASHELQELDATWKNKRVRGREMFEKTRTGEEGGGEEQEDRTPPVSGMLLYRQMLRLLFPLFIAAQCEE